MKSIHLCSGYIYGVLVVRKITLTIFLLVVTTFVLHTTLSFATRVRGPLIHPSQNIHLVAMRGKSVGERKALYPGAIVMTPYTLKNKGKSVISNVFLTTNVTRNAPPLTKHITVTLASCRIPWKIKKGRYTCPRSHLLVTTKMQSKWYNLHVRLNTHKTANLMMSLHVDPQIGNEYMGQSWNWSYHFVATS